MDYTFESIDKTTGVFSLSGNLIGEVDGMQFTEQFEEQLNQGIRYFVLDLSELKHVNSSGLGVFITLLTKARKRASGELFMTNPTAFVENILIITKLTTVFELHKSKEAALEAVKTLQEKEEEA